MEHVNEYEEKLTSVVSDWKIYTYAESEPDSAALLGLSLMGRQSTVSSGQEAKNLSTSCIANRR